MGQPRGCAVHSSGTVASADSADKFVDAFQPPGTVAGYERRKSEGAPLSRHDEPNPSAPAVQRLRLRYAKRGKLRFTSHRDIARAFERALRRAGVPMAFSHGFSPHPKVSWVGAAPTGAASEAEYVEIQVVREVDPMALRAALDAALPPGIDVLEAVVAAGGSLPERIDASRWRIEVPGVGADQLAPAVTALLAAGSVEVERLTKDGRRTTDVRPGIVSIGLEPDTVDVIGPNLARSADDGTEPTTVCGILDVVVRQATPAVRPDDVLSALRVVAALMFPVPARAIRMAQGRLDDEGRLADPLAPDRSPQSDPVVGEPEPGQPVVDRPAG
ncbi:MAG TPA: TIGR03936 family radical SAM-associated protein [Pseudonocardiaceae bacterium]|nr:TIGR03936 family radical SAM-associated protein [Pseudonocardiaceae bacterium]